MAYGRSYSVLVWCVPAPGSELRSPCHAMPWRDGLVCDGPLFKRGPWASFSRSLSIKFSHLPMVLAIGLIRSTSYLQQLRTSL